MDDTSRPRLAVRALWICALLALIVSSVLGVALPADQASAQALGGRQFTLTSQGGGIVLLSWATGTGQTGYRLSRTTAAGTVVIAPSLAGTATSHTDNLGTAVSVACYVLEILNGTTVVGRSDTLCVIVNVAGGQAPRNIQIFTNETAGIGLRWDAPTATSPALFGYLVVPLGAEPLIDPTDGDAIFAPSNRVALDVAPGGFRCYIVLTLIQDGPFRVGGFSDIVCAFVGTFTPQPPSATATRTSTGTPIGGIPTATRTNTVVGNTLTPVNTTTPTVTLSPLPAQLGVVLKTDDPDPVPPGGNVLYTIAISNTGGQPSAAVFVEDTMPAGLTFLTASGNQNFTCNEVQGTVACSSPSLGAGATATISILVRVDNPCVVVSPITNTARTRIGGPPNPGDPNTVTASQQTTLLGCIQATSTATRTATATLTRTITVTGLPVTATATPGVDLTITKFDAPDPVPNGQQLTYTISVTNTGNIAATNITVTDSLDGQLAFQGAAGDSGFVCSNDFLLPSTVTCTGGNIGPNGGATITIVARPFNNPCDGEVYLNTVRVDPSNTIPEANEQNNVAQIATVCGIGQNTPLPVSTFTPTVTLTRTITPTITAIPTTAFSFLKLDAPDPTVIGGSVTYTLRLTNTSPNAISDITLNDVLPAQVVFLGTGSVGGGFVCNQFGAAPGGTGGTVACADGTVPAGGTVDIEIIVSVQGCGPLVNTATIVSPVVANNTATASTTVSGCVAATATVTSTGTVTNTPTVTRTPTTTLTPATNIVVTSKTGNAAALTGDTFSYVITMNATPANAVFTAAQVSFRDVLPAGITSNAAVTNTYGATCTVVGQVVECTGGTITAAPVTVTIPIRVDGCGVVGNVGIADPNNVIPETNEADNQSAPFNTVITCDTQIVKINTVTFDATPLGVNTSGGPAPVTWLLVLDDQAGGSQVAPSTVTDLVPVNFSVVGTPFVAGGTGTCTVTGVPATGQTVACTNVAGPNFLTIQIDVSVLTSVTQGDYTNVAFVATPGDANGANDIATHTVSVFPFDLAVTISDSADPITAGLSYNYTVIVNNTSAGGHASGGFFVNGGMQIRDPLTAGFPRTGTYETDCPAAADCGDITSVTSSTGAPCTIGGGFGGNPERFSCPIGNLAAGGSATITVVVLVENAEPDGGSEPSLDSVLSLVNPSSSCTSGGVPTINCAPEGAGGTLAAGPAGTTPAALLANNRDVEFTDYD